MATLRRRAVHLLLLGGTAVAVIIGPSMLTIETSHHLPKFSALRASTESSPSTSTSSTATSPLRGLGSPAKLPMTGAVIACRGVPACLSYYYGDCSHPRDDAH
jgi:hypothetical protein